MSVEECAKSVVKEIQRLLPVCSAELVTKSFSNGSVAYGVSLRKDGETVSPVLYFPDEFYEEKPKSVARSIVDRYKSLDREGVTIAKDDLDVFTTDLAETWRSRVSLRMYDTSAAPSVVEGKLCFRFLNLTLCPCISIQKDGYALTACITKSMLPSIDASEYDVFGQAFANVRDTKFSVSTMSDVLCELLDSDQLSQETVPLYVITNEQKMNGAIAMLRVDLFSDLCEKLAVHKLAILPSSIHEILAVPVGDDEPEDSVYAELLDMVKEVNHTQVSDADFLTDCVYVFNNETKFLYALTEFDENDSFSAREFDDETSVDLSWICCAD